MGSARLSRSQIAWIACLVGVVAIAAFVWWYAGRGTANEAGSAAQLNSSLDAITATTSVTIPATSNPLKSATPVVNPIEKTNPFNNEYQNPFQ